MNDTIKTLTSRRSCKNFKSEQIKDEELNLILQAGMNAPTGRGLQSPIMVVIQNKSLIQKISKLNASIMGVNVDPFYNAPTLV